MAEADDFMACGSDGVEVPVSLEGAVMVVSIGCALREGVFTK